MQLNNINKRTQVQTIVNNGGLLLFFFRLELRFTVELKMAQYVCIFMIQNDAKTEKSEIMKAKSGRRNKKT